MRRDANETVVIVINRAAAEKQIKIPAGAINLRPGSQLAPLYGAKTSCRVVDGEIILGIPGKMAVAYRVD